MDLSLKGRSRALVVKISPGAHKSISRVGWLQTAPLRRRRRYENLLPGPQLFRLQPRVGFKDLVHADLDVVVTVGLNDDRESVAFLYDVLKPLVRRGRFVRGGISRW